MIKDARKSTSRKDFIDKLQKKHKFSEQQSHVIADLQLHRLGRQDFESIDKRTCQITKRYKLSYLNV